MSNDGDTETDKERNRNADLFKPIRLFLADTELYLLTKEQVSNNPDYDIRSTILWEPGFFIDGSGPIKIKFPNNRAKGTVMVWVNGVSFTNCVGYGKLSYKVQ